MKEKEKKKAPRPDHKPNWQEVYATVEDIQQFLSDRVMLRFNVVTGRVEVHWPTETTSASHRSGSR